MGNNYESAIESLLKLNATQGYITYDYLLDLLDEYKIPLTKTDQLLQDAVDHGCKIFNHVPSENELKKDSKDKNSFEIYDFAQADYDKIYKHVLDIDPELRTLIKYVKTLKPAQHGEASYLFENMSTLPTARQRLFEMQIRGAIRISSQQFECCDEPIADLIQLGAEGLLIAIDKYEPENGPFTSYADMWILQNMNRRTAYHGNGCYFPTHVSDKVKSVLRIKNSHACSLCSGTELYCNNLIKQVMDKLSVTEEEAIRLLTYTQISSSCTDLSENSELLDDTETIDYKKIADNCFEHKCTGDNGKCIEQENEKVFLEQCRNNIKESFELLTDRETEVIELRYGFRNSIFRTLEECGSMFGVTRERIRQIEKKALLKLKRSKNINELKSLYEEFD